MASIPDWITAGASLALAVMAFVAINGTYKLRLPFNLTNRLTADDPADLVRLRDRIAQQATVIIELQSRLISLEASLGTPAGSSALT
jgi:hypothetical protein